jgi:hypothetical protein
VQTEVLPETLEDLHVSKNQPSGENAALDRSHTHSIMKCLWYK